MPARPTLWRFQFLVAQIVIASGLALGWSGSLAWALLDGDATLIAERVEMMNVLQGGLGTLCFLAPLGVLRGVFEQHAPRGGQHWIGRLIHRRSHARALSQYRAHVVEPEATTADYIRLLAFTFLTVGLLVTAPWALRALAFTSSSIGATALLRFLLLPSLLALVHYYSPFVFFDVLIKRGLIWGVLAVTVTVALLLGFGDSLRDNIHPWLPIASVGITLVLGASGTVFTRVNAWLDRVLFQRADYRAELTRLADSMARSSNVDALISNVTEPLALALRATFVRYEVKAEDTSDVVIGLGTFDRPRGFLVFGPRSRGQHYGSEDLTFIDAVAAQLAAHLEAFEAREAAHLATVAELRALRAQINPHFLFNALNTLAELSRGQAAERAIVNLSHVFRYVLESTQHDRVPLGAELDAIRAYLEIEAERFEERLQFVIDVPDEMRDTLVPPMLLQPLVENAVKHGISGKVSGGTVRIGAALDDGLVRITVQDDGVGFDLERTPRRVGLTNVGARLDHTGGSWRVQSIPGAGTRINLTVATS
jgi:signal transduction histidine kinase